MELQEIKKEIQVFELGIAKMLRDLENEHGLTIENIYIRRGIQIGDSRPIVYVKLEVKI